MNIVIEVNRFSKRVRVYKNKIVIPKTINTKRVVYVPSTSPIALFFVILSLVLSLSLIRLFGPFALFLLVASLAIIHAFDSRRKGAEVAALRSILPEDRVFKLIERGVRACRESASEAVTFNDGDLNVEFRCGYPTRCIEYDTATVRKHSLIYAGVLVSMFTTYFYGEPPILIATAVVGLGIVLLLATKPLCKRYKIEKEVVEYRLGDDYS
jgi:hypothetical protein